MGEASVLENQKRIPGNPGKLKSLFSGYCSSVNQGHSPEWVTEGLVRNFFLHVLETGTHSERLSSDMTDVEEQVTEMWSGEIPWSKDIFHFFRNRVQVLTIDNSIDLIKFFREWDASQDMEKIKTRFVLPTPHNEIILIRQNVDTEHFIVNRFCNKVYFCNGRLQPFPPRDEITYCKDWSLVPGALNRLQRSTGQYYMFKLVGSEAKADLFHIRLYNQLDFKCVSENKVSLFDDLPFCIRLKSIEQFFLDWRSDVFYKEMIKLMDGWIERFKTDGNEHFLFNLQAFYSRVYKLATTVYRSDDLFQKYLRELNTNIEFLKYKLDIESSALVVSEKGNKKGRDARV